MSEAPYRFLLRMPQALGDELRAVAESSGRSLNREIVARLERGLEPGTRAGRRPRVGVLAVAAALLLSAGTGFLAGGIDRGARTVQPADATADSGAVAFSKFGWVRAADFDPATRGAGS